MTKGTLLKGITGKSPDAAELEEQITQSSTYSIGIVRDLEPPRKIFGSFEACTSNLSRDTAVIGEKSNE